MTETAFRWSGAALVCTVWISATLFGLYIVAFYVGALMVLAAVQTYRYARARSLKLHRAWVLRSCDGILFLPAESAHRRGLHSRPVRGDRPSPGS